MSKAESRWALMWALFIVGLTCLAHLAAWELAPEGTQYTGLFNPYDGESYYAKMQQGARGDWLFRLPYTPEPHEGAFVYTFYLALGHLAAAAHLPIPMVYHLARAASGVFLLLVSYRLIARFTERVSTRKLAYLLLGLSAGLGWLMALLGVRTADMWVAEGFTFLSILLNPHFPLAIGLMLAILIAVLDESVSAVGVDPEIQASAGLLSSTAGRAGGCVLLGLLLAVVQGLVVPVLAVILAVHLAMLAWQQHRLPLTAGAVALAAGLGAAPMVVYDLVVFRANPAMAAWAAQNVTPSLPPWNYALGYGLILILAVAGLPVAIRRRRPADLLALAWVGSAAVLLYVPFSLQRRFITGLQVPLVLLAALSVEHWLWPRMGARGQRQVARMIVEFTSLTSVMLAAVSVAGVARGEPSLVISAGEAGACAWLRDNTEWTSTVLAPAESGQFFPAYAGNRVVYGHPFETIDAARKRAEVDRFYSAAASIAERQALLKRYGVQYVFIDAPRASVLTPAGASGLGLTEVWNGSGARLYCVDGRP